MHTPVHLQSQLPGTVRWGDHKFKASLGDLARHLPSQNKNYKAKVERKEREGEGDEPAQCLLRELPWGLEAQLALAGSGAGADYALQCRMAESSWRGTCSGKNLPAAKDQGVVRTHYFAEKTPAVRVRGLGLGAGRGSEANTELAFLGISVTGAGPQGRSPVLPGTD